MGEKKSDRALWVRLLRGGLIAGILTFKTLWLTVWTLYQIALGAILVGLVWSIWWVAEYFSVMDIHRLRNENPKATAFIEAERDRLSDSLRMAGIMPKADSLIKWSWLPLDSIPKTISEAVLVAEDAKFFEHQGFDLEQIEYALVANHQAGKKARGASTITQQVAKNLYLSKDKELSRKAREAVITLLLEDQLSKERILEIYLNIAQFDEGVFGVKEAARHHFKKEPANLTQDEAINLICLLPSPVKWNLKRPNNAFSQHKRLVLRNYALFKGMKLKMDTTGTGWELVTYSDLSEQLSEERWKGLRSRPYAEPQAGGDSASPDGSGRPAGSWPGSMGASGREWNRTVPDGGSPPF